MAGRSVETFIVLMSFLRVRVDAPRKRKPSPTRSVVYYLYDTMILIPKMADPWHSSSSSSSLIFTHFYARQARPAKVERWKSLRYIIIAIILLLLCLRGKLSNHSAAVAQLVLKSCGSYTSPSNITLSPAGAYSLNTNIKCINLTTLNFKKLN